MRDYRIRCILEDLYLFKTDHLAIKRKPRDQVHVQRPVKKCGQFHTNHYCSFCEKLNFMMIGPLVLINCLNIFEQRNNEKVLSL